MNVDCSDSHGEKVHTVCLQVLLSVQCAATEQETKLYRAPYGSCKQIFAPILKLCRSAEPVRILADHIACGEVDPAVRLLTATRRAGTQRPDEAREGEVEGPAPASPSPVALWPSAAAAPLHGCASDARVSVASFFIVAEAASTTAKRLWYALLEKMCSSRFR